MVYPRTFPSERRLITLVRHAEFPAGRDELVALAEQKGDTPAILFLSLFDPDDVFENGVDFINRCEELKLLIREEQVAPKEVLRSP